MAATSVTTVINNSIRQLGPYYKGNTSQRIRIGSEEFCHARENKVASKWIARDRFAILASGPGEPGPRYY